MTSMISLLSVGFQNCGQSFHSNNSTQTEASSVPPNVNSDGSHSYAWGGTDWSDCSVVCGGGVQSRTVTCKRDDGANVADTFCSTPKPPISQSCHIQICETYSWQESGFGLCSQTCGGGIQTQRVICGDLTGKQVEESLCSGSKPSSSKTCNAQPCAFAKPVFSAGANFLDMKIASSDTAALVTQNQCYVVEYSSGGVLKRRYLHSLPLLPRGINALRACLPPDLSGTFNIRDMQTGSVTNYSALTSSGTESQCNGLVNYVFNGKDTLLIGGKFSNSPLQIVYQGVFSQFSDKGIISDPGLLARNQDGGTYTWRDLSETFSAIEPSLAAGISSNETLSLFIKSSDLPANYIAHVSQGSIAMDIAPMPWNCPSLERPDQEINMWLEAPISYIDSNGGQEKHQDGSPIDLSLLGSSKFQNDMQTLWNAGLKSWTFNPLTSFASPCSQLTSDYKKAISLINQNGRNFQFVIEPNFYPDESNPSLFRSWDTPANMSWAQQVSPTKVEPYCNDGQNSNWMPALLHDSNNNPIPNPLYSTCNSIAADKGIFYVDGSGMANMWKGDVNTVRDQYSCLINSVLGNPTANLAGIIPWQEPSSHSYTQGFQNNLLDSFRKVLANTNRKVYGFDGWVMDTNALNDPKTSTAYPVYLHDYVNPNFGEVLIHQSYPGQCADPLPNGASALQAVVDGIRFEMRGLKRNGRTAPIKFMAYLQANGKGDASSLSCDPNDTMAFARAKFKSHWSMWAEYEAQVAAAEFYGYKYSLPSSVVGVQFYYYGNYFPNNPDAKSRGYSSVNTGISHAMASPSEIPGQHSTQCYPRIENSPEIFNEVIGVIGRLKTAP